MAKITINPKSSKEQKKKLKASAIKRGYKRTGYGVYEKADHTTINKTRAEKKQLEAKKASRGGELQRKTPTTPQESNSAPVIEDIKFEGSSIPEDQDPALVNTMDELPEPMLNQEEREAMTSKVNLNDITTDAVLEEQYAQDDQQKEAIKQKNLEQAKRVNDAVLAIWYAVDFNPNTKNVIADFDGMAAKMLEAAANHPFQAAGYVTAIRGMINLARQGLTRMFGGAANWTSPDTGITFIRGTKTKMATASKMNKLFGAGAVLWFGSQLLETIGMGKWGRGEATEYSDKFYEHAVAYGEQTDDWSLFENLQETYNNVVNRTTLEKWLEWSPFGGIEGTDEKLDAKVAELAVSNAYYNMQRKFAENNDTGETGMSPDWRTNTEEYIKWKAGIATLEREEEEAMYRRNEEYSAQLYKENTLLQDKLERERAAIDAANWTKSQEDSLKFLKKRLKLQAKFEKEEREATSKYWLNYYKMKARMEDATRGSNLSFGLI